MSKKISQKKFIKNLYDQKIERKKVISLVKEALDDGTLFKKPNNMKSNEKAAKDMVRIYYYIFRKADKTINELEKMQSSIETPEPIKKSSQPPCDTECTKDVLQNNEHLVDSIKETLPLSSVTSSDVKLKEKSLVKKSFWDL